MLFFNSSKTLLCLKSTSLEIYRTKPYFFNKVDFQTSMVNHLEVKNAEGLASQIHSFITSLGIPKQKVKLLLSEGVTYHKEFPLVEYHQNPKIGSVFLNQLPFESRKLAQLEVTTREKVHLLVANRELYLTVIQGIEKAGWEVESASPASLFGQFQEDQKLTEEEVKKIDHTSWWHQANFIQAKGVQMDESLPTQATEPVAAPTSSAAATAPMSPPPNKLKRILIGTVLVVFILAMATFSLMNFGIIKNPLNQNSASVTPSPESLPSTELTVSPEATDSAQATSSSQAANASASANIDKTKITITVINSSGVPGQAAALTEALKAKGYTQVSPTSGLEPKTKTTVKASPQLSSMVKEEIAKVLIAAGLNPVAEDDASLAETEVVVETGKEASGTATASATPTP